MPWRSGTARAAFGVLSIGLIACCFSGRGIAWAVVAVGTGAVTGTFVWELTLVGRAARFGGGRRVRGALRRLRGR